MMHDLGCKCKECEQWYEAVKRAELTGIHSCGKLIDEHQLDKRGRVAACPQGAR